MISTAIALYAAGLTMQASDTTRAAREAFTHCLSGFVDRSIQERKTLADFNAAFPQACATEQAAFRTAVIARDTAMRATRASANESADLEVEDARANFNDRFQMSLPASQVAHAAAPAAATPAPAPAATAAAAPATPPAAAPAGQPAVTHAAQTTGAAQPAQPH